MVRILGGLLLDRLLRLPPAWGGYEVERDLPIPMPDGVRLLGDLYRPRRTAGASAVVLVRLPYGRAGLNGMVLAATLARRGHQVLIQSTRGTFGSGGRFRPFANEHEDGLATVAWVRSQSWCDGRVAMTGGSYFGHTQWAVAPYVDPPLVSFAPHVSSSHITRPFYEGGAPALETSLAWVDQLGHQERGVLGRLPTPWRTLRLRRAQRTLPLRAADVVLLGAPHPFWRDFVEHADPRDPFWSASDHSHVDRAHLTPAPVVTGWWDLFLPGQLADVVALRAAGRDARVVVGPWKHGEPDELRAMLRTDIDWLGHHLRGESAPHAAPFTVALQQTDSWLRLDIWPPRDSVPLSYYLHPNGRLEAGTPSSRAASTTLTYDPDDPTPNLGGPLLAGRAKQRDQTPLEARQDVLTFTSEPVVAPMDIVGNVSARIHVRASVEHYDVVVRLCDVDRSGRSRNIVDGIRRVTPTTAPAPDSAHRDDGTTPVEVTLHPTAYRVAAGHRIRAQVCAGAFPRIARNLGSADPLPTAVDARPYRIEVFLDQRRPSFLTVDTLSTTATARDDGGRRHRAAGRPRPTLDAPAGPSELG